MSSVHDRLNELSQAINANFGFIGQVPRVNLGPCADFAKLFRDAWTGRFAENVTVCFLMSEDMEVCFHCFIKLPGGDFFDGGNGVVAQEDAGLLLAARQVFHEMTEYDERTFEEYAHGFGRNHSGCPAYSNEKAKELVEQYLDSIAGAGLTDARPAV